MRNGCGSTRASILLSHFSFLHSLDLPHVDPRAQRTQLHVAVALLVRRRDRLSGGWHVDQEDLIAGSDLRQRGPPAALLARRATFDRSLRLRHLLLRCLAAPAALEDVQAL